jgi:hypothetical protein
VSALCYRIFIYVVYADNLLCTWLTGHIYVALTGFTYVATSITVSIRRNRHQAKTKMSGFYFKSFEPFFLAL